MYKLSRDEIKGDFRPYGILKKELENDFYDNIPNQDEGHTISNKQAGINPTKKSRQLNIVPNSKMNQGSIKNIL